MSSNSIYAKFLKELNYVGVMQNGAESISGINSVSKYMKDIEANSSWNKLAKSITTSSIISEHLKSIDKNNSWRKLAESLSAGSSISKHLRDIEVNNSWSKLAKSLTASSAISKHLKSIESNSSWGKLAGPLSEKDSFTKHLKYIEENSSLSKLTKSLANSNSIFNHIEENSSWNKLVKSLTASDAVSRHLRNIEANSSWEKLAESLSAGSSINKYLRELDGVSSVPKWAESLTSSRAFVESFERLQQADYIDSLLEDIGQHTPTSSASIDAELAAATDQDVDEVLRQMASAESPLGFSKALEKAPWVLKWLLLSIWVAFVWPLLIGTASGVIGNLVTPYVQAYLEETKATPQREQVKTIKKLSFSELGIELSDYRFVSANILLLRATPNARAPIVGELKFGQVVNVLSKSRDWTEVTYEYGDGTKIQGWVFTRYTAKFRS